VHRGSPLRAGGQRESFRRSGGREWGALAGGDGRLGAGVAAAAAIEAGAVAVERRGAEVVLGAREGHAGRWWWRWWRTGGAHARAERGGQFAARDAGEAALAGGGALGAAVRVAEEGGDGGAEGGHEAGALGHAGAAGEVAGVVGFGREAGVGWEGLMSELGSSPVVA